MPTGMTSSDSSEPEPELPRELTIFGHSWRELSYEVFVVVLGVALALIGQQTVDDINWHFKVRSAEAAIKMELGDDLSLAEEHKQLHPCMTAFLDRLEQAVVASDARAIRALRELKPPLPGRAWPRDTWTAALNNQVSDHISDGRVATYSRAFLRVGVQREFMQEMEGAFPIALSGGFGVPSDAGVVHSQLVAIEQLRSLEARRLMISESLLNEDGPSLAIKPSRRYFAEAGTLRARCQRGLIAISGS